MSHRNHPRPGWSAEQIFACLVDPCVAATHQTAAAVELGSRLLGGLIGIDYAASVEDGPDALMSALERPEIMPAEHAVAGGLSVPQAVLMALAGHCDVPPASPQAYAMLVEAGMVPIVAALLLPPQPQSGWVTRALRSLKVMGPPPPLTDPMTAAAVMAHLLVVPEAGKELAAMGMLPCLIDLLPRIWQVPADTDAKQPSDSVPSAAGSDSGVRKADNFADAAEVTAWQEDCSQTLNPTHRAGPLICLSQLAAFKVLGLQSAVQPLMDILAWVQRNDDVMRSDTYTSHPNDGQLLISFARQLGITTARQLADSDSDGAWGQGSIARALADSGGVKVLSGLQQTSMEQKWDRLVFAGGIALAAAVNGLPRPLKQVKSSGVVEPLLVVMSSAHAHVQQNSPDHHAAATAAAERAGRPPPPPPEDFEQALTRTAACFASLATRCPQAQEILLEANALPAFLQLLKSSPAACGASLEATTDATVVVGLLCSGRPASVATIIAAGYLPRLLTMLRSTQTGKVGRRQRYSAAESLYRLTAPVEDIFGSPQAANTPPCNKDSDSIVSAATLAVDMGAAQMLVPLLGKRGTALPAVAAMVRLHGSAAPASRSRIAAAAGLMPKLLGLAALVAKPAVKGTGESPLADDGWAGLSWEESICDFIASLIAIGGTARGATAAEVTTGVKLVVNMLKRFPDHAAAMEQPLLSLTATHPSTKVAAKEAWADTTLGAGKQLSKPLAKLLQGQSTT